MTRIEFKKPDFDFDEVWLTSDTHYLHKNMARGTSSWTDKFRDFDTPEQMTNLLIENINKLVKPNDLLIHCGDWSFQGKDNILKCREMINCKNIILIQGNHDQHINQSYVENGCFKEFTQIGYYKFGEVKLVCCHFPIAQWYHKHKGSYHAFGHCHSQHIQSKSLDVGVDSAYKILGDYRPFHIVELIKTINNENN